MGKSITDYGRFKRGTEKQEQIILMIDLLLNKIPVDNIHRLKLIEDSETVKLFGIPSDEIDESAIAQDKKILVPRLRSLSEFNNFVPAKEIFEYTPAKSFVINDMDIIAPDMVIDYGYVVSTIKARDFDDIPKESFGFALFYEYVVTNELSFDKWKISYKDNFSVYYSDELMYRDTVTKQDSFALVLYIIKKAVQIYAIPIRHDDFHVERCTE